MKKLVYAVCIGSLLALGACKGGGGGSKCEQAITKAMNMAMEMAGAMGAMAGDAAKVEEAKKQMKAEMDKKMPEAIKKCEEAIKGNPEAEKALDCIIGASDMEAMSKCDDSALKNLM